MCQELHVYRKFPKPHHVSCPFNKTKEQGITRKGTWDMEEYQCSVLGANYNLGVTNS